MAPGARRRESFSEQRARRADVDDPAIVFEAALRFLEARQRSVAEVRRRLTTAGYREDLVTGAIDRLGDLGMLDDAAFAAQWVESRDRARPRGERALRQELHQKGIDRTLVDEAMDARRPDPGGESDPDLAAAERLLARHASALGRVADLRARRQRAYALLARNGFDAETCRTVSATVMAEPSDDPSDGSPDD